jgi:hypothetical protein
MTLSRSSRLEAKMAADAQRFRELKADLLRIDYFSKGTVLRRMMKCGKPKCPCTSDPNKRHGPYFEWTYKEKGKTVNVRLTAESAPLFQEAARQYRQLKSILVRLEKLSRQAIGRLAKHAGTTPRR